MHKNRNHHSYHNDYDNDNNFDNDNGDQTMMIFQAMRFGEPFVCEKTKFCESVQILMCLHSAKPCLIYRGELKFSKNYRNKSSRSLCKLHGVKGNPYRKVSTAFNL